MAKMKGEALTLLGKVEGKHGHDKVEEGQRIKAGLPPQSPTSAGASAGKEEVKGAGQH